MPFERRPLGGAKKPKKSFFPVFIIFVFCVLFLSFFWVKSTGDIIVASGEYNLEKGITLSTLPEALDIEVSDFRYKLYLKFFSRNTIKLQAGTYTIEKDAPLVEVLSGGLDRPTHTDITITILPGWNMYDIDSYLSDKNILPPGAFLLGARDHFSTFVEKYDFLEGVMSLEGFLYPDTYRILPTADVYMILDRLLLEWERKIGEAYMKLGPSAYEELILASIVEREERIPSEKPKVADILAKRVREGIAMGADATVCYGYAKTQKQCTPEFIGSIIREKHPYNTRNMLGYPPTPISSISQNTWNAVMNKEPSVYYYYLHDGDGVIHYARTNAEHVQNKQKYLQ